MLSEPSPNFRAQRDLRKISLPYRSENEKKKRFIIHSHDGGEILYVR
jgi:hypothetical protein